MAERIATPLLPRARRRRWQHAAARRLLRICRNALGGRTLLGEVENLTTRGPASVRRRPCAGAGIHQGRHRAGLPRQRHAQSRHQRLRRPHGERLQGLGDPGRRPGRESAQAFPGGICKAMPSRTQITRHDCVEGWSCIGEWTGTPLPLVLALAKPKPEARYVVFYCADPMGEGGVDAPATGAAALLLREPRSARSDSSADASGLRTERNSRCRWSMARRCACAPSASLATNSPNMSRRSIWWTAFARIGGGKGGYWEDQGYNGTAASDIPVHCRPLAGCGHQSPYCELYSGL